MTGKFPFKAVLLLTAVLGCGVAKAAVLAVPAQYPTIAEAIEAAQPADRIEISPGTYAEFGLTLPNGVSVVGLGDGPEAVVIDGGGRGRILLAESVDQSSLLANLTFVNGRAHGPTNYDSSGGAIFCSNSSLRISNCIFRNNTSDGQGGAIRCNNSTPLITGCVFEGNAANRGGGGAIDCSFGSSPLIRGCVFRANTAAWGGAISCRGSSSPSIYGGIFLGNSAVGSKAYGGAVFADFESAPHFQQSTYFENAARYGGAVASLGSALTQLENCTLAANSASVLGGGLFSHGSSPRISQSIFAFHIGAGITAAGGSMPIVTCTDIFGNSGGDWVGGIASQLDVGDNISADPLFCASGSTTLPTFTLTGNSPCGSADLDCGYMGAWPVGCDAYVTTLSTFDAVWQGPSLHLAWQSRTTGGGAPQFRLTGARQDDPANVWDVVFDDLGGGYFTAVDPVAGGNEAGTYVYRLYMAEPGSDWELLDELLIVSVPDYPGIRELQAWPNPFNPQTTISFRLGQAQAARVSVFSPAGRRVAELAAGEFGVGLHELAWDGRDQTGQPVGSGTYIVLVEGRTERQTQKITLLK